MSKTAKLMIVFCCLAAILVIFIAPQVDSPDTVLPGGHHVVRGGSSTTVTVLIQITKISHSNSLGMRQFQYTLSAAGRRSTVSRELTTVLRC